MASLSLVDSPMFPLAGFDDWFDDRMASHRFQVDETPFAEMQDWGFSANGDIAHKSGRYFRIEGAAIRRDGTTWKQPMIHQPEVGYLGFLLKNFDGVPHFLVQAKMEPGNIRFIQLSPTLQATKSNYTRVHKGRSPKYLDYFRDRTTSTILFDSLQSEQGGRFLHKRNRNMVIAIDDDQEIRTDPDFIWLTLGQIHRLLDRDNLVNMDSRTVIACLGAYQLHFSDAPLDPWGADTNGLHEILSWITELKCMHELNVRHCSLNDISPWLRTERSIYHPEKRFFEVIAVRVEADNREVGGWAQPMLKPAHTGLLALIVKPGGEEPLVLIQAVVEPGTFDTVELGPTVQYLDGDIEALLPTDQPPFTRDVLDADPATVLFDRMQSEEGGRFFRDENRNLIVQADAAFDPQLDDHYRWIPLSRLQYLIRHNNVLNVQVRCLLSALTATIARKP